MVRKYIVILKNVFEELNNVTVLYSFSFCFFILSFSSFFFCYKDIQIVFLYKESLTRSSLLKYKLFTYLWQSMESIELFVKILYTTE